jgi:hypothetical protein
MITEERLREVLRLEVDKAGDQSKWARKHGIKPQYVSAVLRGEIGVGRQIYEALKYKKIIAFSPCDSSADNV